MTTHRFVVLDPVNPHALLAAASAAAAGPASVSHHEALPGVHTVLTVTTEPRITIELHYPADSPVRSLYRGLGYRSWYAVLVVAGPATHLDEVSDVTGASGWWLNLGGYRWASELLDGTYHVMPAITREDLDAVDAAGLDPEPYRDDVAPDHAPRPRGRWSRLREFALDVLHELARTERRD